MWNKNNCRILEYSIIMLKPDGYEMDLRTEIIQQLNKLEFEVVEQFELMLSAKDVKNNFLHPTDEYIEYLTKGLVKIFLVKGYNPHIKLYEMKKKIRKKYGVDKSVRNLIHTVDEGNEYHKFLECFFNHRKLIQYSNSMDFNLCLTNDAKKNIKILETLDRESELIYIALNLNYLDSTQVTEIFSMNWLKLQPIFMINKLIKFKHQEVNLLVYFLDSPIVNFELVQLVKNTEDLGYLFKIINQPQYNIFVDNIPISQEELNNYRYIIRNQSETLDECMLRFNSYKIMKELIQEGVIGLICFRPDLTLLETELRMDICRLLNLHIGGSSSNLKEQGHFSVSINCLF